MRIAHVLPAILFFTAVALMGDGTPAQADDCYCGDGGAYVGRHAGYHHGRATSCRDPYHPSTRRVIPRHRGHRYHRGCSYGYGTPWRVLRRGLRGLGTHEYRRWYVGQYFLHRYPFAVVEAEEARIDTLLAAADELEAGAKLPPEAHLRRGMARFYVADYKGAEADFDAVLAVRPKETRARYGRLFIAIVRNDWKTAVGHLNGLAQAGELKKGDRVVAEGTFSDPKKFGAVVRGLVGNAQYSISDGDAHLVAAWALAATGDESKARSFARLARRWKSSNAALPALEENLGIAKKKAEAPVKPTPATHENPVPAPRSKGEPAGRVVAAATKVGS